MRVFSGYQSGHYVFGAMLGAGGMAEVWSATHTVLGVQVAVKVLARPGAAPRARLLREGRVQAAMDHPNLLPVRDVIDVADRIGLVMPLVRGPSLDQLRRHRPLTEPEAVAVFSACLSGIGFAHQQGLIHRDIKPANVLLEPRWGQIGIRVSDFGLVQLRDTPDEARGVMGTLGYAAPEQLQPPFRVDHRADLFSLGVMFVELLSGRLPFKAVSLEQLREALSGPPDLDGVPARWRALCGALLSPVPGDRPPDCEAIRAQLPPTPPALLRLGGPLADAVAAAWDGSAAAEATTPNNETFSSEILGTAPPQNNLPDPVDAFVGRAAELAALQARLAASRLVTVCGPGGMGKTRLSIQAARALNPAPPGGVWWCDLTEVYDQPQLEAALARALGVPLGTGGPMAHLGRAIDSLGPCLLVLDNAEQIAGLVADALAQWRARAKAARFLVTSRVLLGLPGEAVCPLDPMTEADAIALFQARSATGASPALRALVQQLDAMPLAVELAAARARAMPPETMLARMDERFRLLAPQRRGVQARQATLRATIDWSWALLSAPAQDALAQLSVFDGGFTVEAAEAVVDLSDHPDAPWTIDVLQQLVEHSLLRRSESPPRLGMLLSIRAYAAEQLTAEAAANTRLRHARAFAAAGTPERIAALSRGERGLGLLEALEAEQDNLRAALEFAIARPAPALAVQLGIAWQSVLSRRSIRARVLDALHRVREIQPPGADPGEQIRLLRAIGRLSLGRGDAQAAVQHYDDAHEIACRAGRADDEATTRIRRAKALFKRGDAGAPLVADIERGLAAAQALGNVLLESEALDTRAALHFSQGRHAEALRDRTRSLALAREAGVPLWECRQTAQLGEILLHTGELPRAEAMLTEALAQAEEQGAEELELSCITRLGNALFRQGKIAEVLSHSARVQTLARVSPSPTTASSALGTLGNLHYALGRIERAHAMFADATEIAGSSGQHFAANVWRMMMGYTLRGLGRLDEALLQLERVYAFFGGTRYQARAGLARCLIGSVRRRQGDLEQAEEALTEALQMLRATDNKGHIAVTLGELAQLRALQGALPLATSLATEGLRSAEQLNDPRTQGILLQILGTLVGQQDPDAGRPLLHKSVHISKRSNPTSCATALAALAILEQRCGRREEAAAALAQAASIVSDTEIAANQEMMQHYRAAQRIVSTPIT